ncbi:uncharacterized protein [Gossypium hirsutum]|uniref:Retroviral polymerase SH3-like domain-containing protein n=1 Tax=Gossypium hirsutum TaxID=3635 RepID=A0A1U8L7L1_GOSHI|nr:uncharacterized protein LOC107923458 [Gossypium hirsutum]
MSSSSFSPTPPLMFNSERANPTVAQIRQHYDDRAKRYKAMSCLQNSVSDLIFIRIIACETPKQAWDKLKEEFHSIEKIRQQQLIKLRRDFENLKMKETETIKQYSDRIMAFVNNIRLLGDQFSESGIVEKVIANLPKRYEVKISFLEDSRDLSTISLNELINAFHAQEQRRTSRQEKHHEGAFQTKSKPTSSSSSYKGKKNWLPTKALLKKTPFEVWSRFKPSVVHLRIFGCICYAHVLIIKREKLEKKAQLGILVGYNSVEKGYRILDPTTYKVFVNRYVVFDEKAAWNWDKAKLESVTKDLVTGANEVD